MGISYSTQAEVSGACMCQQARDNVVGKERRSYSIGWAALDRSAQLRLPPTCWHMHSLHQCMIGTELAATLIATETMKLVMLQNSQGSKSDEYYSSAIFPRFFCHIQRQGTTKASRIDILDLLMKCIFVDLTNFQLYRAQHCIVFDATT